jgi:hypothetical protein
LSLTPPQTPKTNTKPNKPIGGTDGNKGHLFCLL